MTVTDSASSGVKPRSRSVWAGSFGGAAHFLQTRRTSRWATMRTTESAIRNGSTFMFMSRWTVLAESLVWMVEKTRWPVRAALMAMSTVSGVAHLADQHDVGVLAEEGPEGRGEVQVDLVPDVDLVDARACRTRPGPRPS